MSADPPFLRNLFRLKADLDRYAAHLAPGPPSVPRNSPNMSRSFFMNSRGSIAAVLLLGSIVATGAGLAAWKYTDIAAASAAAANQPEPMESVTAAVAKEREHRRTTTSIGTVLALRSITLRNELAGTVRQVRLTPGQIVEAGTVLVALDASVEEAELEAQEAQAALAETTLERLENLREHRATSQEEVDQARAERDVALAQMARTRAVIAKKIIRAPFRARVGLADVHPGPVPERGHRAHHAAGRRRRRARGLHGRPAGRGRSAGGRQRGRLRRERQRGRSSPHRRGGRAGGSHHPQRDGPRHDRRRCHRRRPAPRCGCWSRSGPPSQAVVVPVQRPPQGARGRPRVRDRRRHDRQDPRAPEAGGERPGAGRRGPDPRAASRPASRSPPRGRSSCARRCWSRSPTPARPVGRLAAPRTEGAK